MGQNGSKQAPTNPSQTSVLENLFSTLPQDKFFLGLLAVLFFIVVIVYHFYLSWNRRKLDKIEEVDKECETTVKCKELTQQLVVQNVLVLRKHSEAIHMALYFSETRRAARARRPARPRAIETRTPQLLPNLTAERCRQDGLAILQITDEEDRESSVSTRSWRPRREEIAGSGETVSPRGIAADEHVKGDETDGLG